MKVNIHEAAEAYSPTATPGQPEPDPPQQKLLAHGPAQLSDTELLAILLRGCLSVRHAADLACSLLSAAGGLQRLARLEFLELLRQPNIGTVKAVTLVAAFELGRRATSKPLPPRLKIGDPEAVYRCYGPLLAHRQQEVFMVLALNSANGLIRDFRISEGILNASLVHPREIFRSAVLASAASIILLHNHPSGAVRPSREDRAVTRRLVEAGKLMDISVLDHLIIGDGHYFSFREAGILEE